MITRSSLRPVIRVMDWLRSTSLSFFRPSGVSSKAQAKISTIGRPMASTSMMVCMTQSGAPMFSSTRSATCSRIQAAIA